MGRGDHLGDLEAMVLAAVVRREPDANGTAVWEELLRRAGRDPSLPAIHVTLRRLEGKGLVASREGARSPRGGRPRRFYRATPNGVESLGRFRAEWRALLAGVDLPDPDVGA